MYTKYAILPDFYMQNSSRRKCGNKVKRQIIKLSVGLVKQTLKSEENHMRGSKKSKIASQVDKTSYGIRPRIHSRQQMVIWSYLSLH